MLKTVPDPTRGASGQSDHLRPLSLACFGRGGSSLVWGALASAQGTLTMDREWHEAVFDGAGWLRRALRRMTRHDLGLALGTGPGPTARLIRQAVRARVLADIRRTPPWVDESPEWLALKLMDYNIVRLPLIEEALGNGRVVLLTRGPLGQCESLMRSGLRLDQACRWYNDVSRAMARLYADPCTVTVRFEDLITAPDTTFSDMFRQLGLPCPEVFYLKSKAYGDARQQDTDVCRAPVTTVPRATLGQFVDPEANARAIARLRPPARIEIGRRTAGAACALGYRVHDD
jgi:hypothetical protein